MSDRRPRLLFVTYLFPPVGGPGVQRVTKIAKYLVRYGWDVTVLTVADPPSATRDESLGAELSSDVRVLRAWSLEPTRLVQWARRMRGGASRDAGATPSSYTGAPSRFVRFVQAFFSPDEKRFWMTWAIPEAVRAHGERPFDLILSSGPPFTAHVLARRLAQRFGVPYAVDMRDAWVGNPFFRPATPANAWLTRRAEARVIGDAALVVTTAESVARDLRQRYAGKSGIVSVYNGFDRDDMPGVPAHGPSPDRLVLAHVGTFSATRSPRCFFEGLALAEREEASLRDTLEVRFVGAGREVKEMASAAGVASAVRYLGYVPHDASLLELAQASVALLIVPEGEESRSAIPAKLYEYLALRRPILALLGAGDARDVLRTVRGARIVSPGDPAAIAGALLELYRAWGADALEAPTEQDASRYDRAVQMRRYSELLHAAVESPGTIRVPGFEQEAAE